MCIGCWCQVGPSCMLVGDAWQSCVGVSLWWLARPDPSQFSSFLCPFPVALLKGIHGMEGLELLLKLPSNIQNGIWELSGHSFLKAADIIISYVGEFYSPRCDSHANPSFQSAVAQWISPSCSFPSHLDPEFELKPIHQIILTVKLYVTCVQHSASDYDVPDTVGKERQSSKMFITTVFKETVT